MLCSSPISAIDLPKDGDPRARAGRDVHPALRHRGQQSDGLEHDRLAAGVGPGDQQQIEVIAQPHVDGHDLIGQLRHAGSPSAGSPTGAAADGGPGEGAATRPASRSGGLMP